MKKALALFAALALVLVAAAPAEASWWHHSSNDTDIDIDVDNSAYVKNTVTTVADTGGNTADGGNATSRAYGRGADSEANGGDGGTIDTGDAIATSLVSNFVNDTDIKVKSDCGCRGDLDVDIDVDNNAKVKNYVTTIADTGGNTANGGDANSKAKNSSHGHGWSWHSSSTDSEANGGDGGSITTGDADALSSVVNVVNTNVVRVIR